MNHYISDPCKDVHCLNNGTCSPIGWTGYECKCPDPFYGPVCELGRFTSMMNIFVFIPTDHLSICAISNLLLSCFAEIL